MTEILDYNNPKNTGEKFTLTSLICSSLAVAIFGYVLNFYTGSISARESIYRPSVLLVRTEQALVVLGIIFLILSYIKKEPQTWKKSLATILNLLLLIVIVGSIMFRYLVDGIL